MAIGILLGTGAVLAAAASLPAQEVVAGIPGTSWRECDPTAVTAVARRAKVRVLASRLILKGEPVPIGQGTGLAGAAPEIATSDVCVLKLNAAHPVPGPAGAPSTSSGIGIELWLPAREAWNHRFLSLLPGGFAGDPAVQSTTQMSRSGDDGFATVHGYATSVTDLGVQGERGNVLMLQDGSINSEGWENLSRRASHVVAETVKVAAATFYKAAPSFSYVFGCSSGGRASYSAAQNHPDDFDGVLAESPSINQTSFPIGLVYPQMIMLRELGGPISMTRLDFVSRAAVAACDMTVTGKHDGFLSDPDRCNYDPTKDRSVLCATDGGNAPGERCITRREAGVVNRIWYGATRETAVIDPSRDSGASPTRAPGQYWWGPYRGTTLMTVANSKNGQPAPFDMALDQFALNSEDPGLAAPSFHNAAGNGKEGWKRLDYAGFADLADRGRVLNERFADIDSNNPDLRRFVARGGRMMTIHGLADQNMPPQNSINYYLRVAAVVGGLADEQRFHRLFLVPGRAHCGGIGTVGASNVPEIDVHAAMDQLVNWVERKDAPIALAANSSDGKMSRPVCAFPRRIRARGPATGESSDYVCVAD